MAKITVIGSFNIDMVIHMAAFPLPGQTVTAKTPDYLPGGKGANQAVACARIGGDVEMIGKLGDDAYGRDFRRLMQDEGIDISHVFTSSLPTGMALIQINDAGENQICVIPSANHDLDMNDVDAIDPLLGHTEWVILQLELRPDVTFELIRRCHRHGVRVVLNPAPAIPIDAEILSLVDYLTPNETELSILTGMPVETDEQIAAATAHLLALGVGNVVATVGSRGAAIANADGFRIVPGFPVKPIDTVAAGDSFNGALVHYLSIGTPLEQAVRYANAVGALTVTKKGAIPSLPTKEQLAAFLQSCEA